MLIVTGLLGIAGACAKAVGAPNAKSAIAVAAAVPGMRRRTSPFLCDTFIGDSPLGEAAPRRTRAARCGAGPFQVGIELGSFARFDASCPRYCRQRWLLRGRCRLGRRRLPGNVDAALE